MTSAVWLSGPSGASPAMWIDRNGKAQIDSLAFSMADEAGRALLLDQASHLEAEFATRPGAKPPALSSRALSASGSAEKANELIRATDELIAAHLLFVAVLEDLRDEIGHDRPRRGQEAAS